MGLFPIREDVGEILFDDIACVGNEETILDCEYTIFEHDCTHSEDAAVYCSNGTSTTTMRTTRQTTTPLTTTPTTGVLYPMVVRGGLSMY